MVNMYSYYRVTQPVHPEELVRRPIPVKPEFQPRYFETVGNNKTIMAINAITEIIEVWKYVHKDALHNYPHMYSQLSIPISDELRLACRKHKESFAVYDKITQTWLIEPSDTYNFCYNGHDFEDFEEAKSKITGKRLLLVGKYTKLMQEPNLVNATAKAPLSYADFVMPSTRLTVGVPGCGKTRYIVKHHTVVPPKYATSMILTSCAEGAEDVRSRMAKRFGGRPCEYRCSCKTIDSYLLHSRESKPRIWVDEALMEHPGKLFLVCLFSRCQYLFLLGDPNQLGYINRINDITLRYDKTALFFEPAETLHVSYRCPVDVMAILSRNYEYEGGAHSASKIQRSLTCKTFTSLENVPNLIDTKYLVFKQAEKKKMKAAGYDVSTVHEFQGKEARNVVLVRMSSNLREELYESPPHVLVALSRHTDSLVYYTPVRDKLANLVNTQLTAEELSSHLWVHTDSLVVAGGGGGGGVVYTPGRDRNTPLTAKEPSSLWVPSFSESIVIVVELCRTFMSWICSLFGIRNVDHD